MVSSKRSIGVAEALGTAALWPLGAVFAVLSFEEGYSIGLVLATRFAFSILVLSGFLLVTNPQLFKAPRKSWPYLLGYSVALVVTNGLYYVSIDRIPVGVTISLQMMSTTMVLIWTTLVEGKRHRPGVWCAALVSLLGVVLVSDAINAWRGAHIDALGIVAALVSSVGVAGVIIFSGSLGKLHVPAKTTTFWSFTISTVFWLCFAPLWHWPWHDIALTHVGAWLAAVAIIGTLLPFVLLSSAGHKLPSSTVAMITTSEPAFGALFGWIVLSQHLSATQILGGLLVMGGVIAAEALTRREALVPEAVA